jgi:peptidoglycan/xylan/chitin deacetylase (PgdA/CDA1 family)
VRLVPVNPPRCLRIALVACVLVALAAGCGPAATQRPTVRARMTTPSAVPTSTAVPPARRTDMVAWHRPVEELFVHPLVLDPAAAFTDDTLGRGFQDYFVTTREFRALLEQLWRNGWTLVDIHRVVDGTVRVPRGRRPLVLVEDDVNYYHYFEGRGLAAGLVLGADDQVHARLDDGTLTDDDVVPMVEAAVAAHPELSADGARGVLAVTGYEGLFGEHDPDRPDARDRLTTLAGRLRATGWTFASHTYGHLDLSRSSPDTIMADSARWKALADPILGPVDVLVYPYGARPTASVVARLAAAGYVIQLDIDVVARQERVGGATLMSRRHVDGLAFDVPERQRPFYDVAKVRDPRRPTAR